MCLNFYILFFTFKVSLGLHFSGYDYNKYKSKKSGKCLLKDAESGKFKAGRNRYSQKYK